LASPSASATAFGPCNNASDMRRTTLVALVLAGGRVVAALSPPSPSLPPPVPDALSTSAALLNSSASAFLAELVSFTTLFAAAQATTNLTATSNSVPSLSLLPQLLGVVAANATSVAAYLDAALPGAPPAPLPSASPTPDPVHSPAHKVLATELGVGLCLGPVVLVIAGMLIVRARRSLTLPALWTGEEQPGNQQKMPTDHYQP